MATLIVWTFVRIYQNYADQRLLYRPAAAMLGLLLVQLSLGALTVWSAKSVIPTTAHVATGAMTLGTSFLLTVYVLGIVTKRAPALVYPFREPAWK